MKGSIMRLGWTRAHMHTDVGRSASMHGQKAAACGMLEPGARLGSKEREDAGAAADVKHYAVLE